MSSAWTGSGVGRSRPSRRMPASAMPLLICTRLSKPAALAPRTAPPVRIQAHVDESRSNRPASRGVQAQPRQRIRPIAVDQHVGLRQQLAQRSSCRRLAQIEPRAALAQRDLRHHTRLVPAGRIDAQHVGAKAGEEARGHRTGQDARQVQHAHALQRPRRRGTDHVGDGPASVSATCTSGSDATARPCGCAAHSVERLHRRGAAARLDDGVFQLTAQTSRDHRRGHCRALGRHVARPRGHGAVVRRVGVEPDPAVAVDSRRRPRPSRRHAPALGRSEPANHNDARRRSTSTPGGGPDRAAPRSAPQSPPAAAPHSPRRGR